MTFLTYITCVLCNKLLLSIFDFKLLILNFEIKFDVHYSQLCIFLVVFEANIHSIWIRKLLVNKLCTTGRDGFPHMTPKNLPQMNIACKHPVGHEAVLSVRRAKHTDLRKAKRNTQRYVHVRECSKKCIKPKAKDVK